MPLGIVSNDEFEQELIIDRRIAPSKDIEDSDNSNASELGIVKDSPIGRGKGTTEKPEEVRKFIAESLIEGIKAKELGDLMNVSQSSMSAYQKGATSTSTYDKKDEKLVKHITNIRERISRKAGKVLNDSLNELMTGDRLQHAKTRDLAAIARNMSAIVKEQEEEKKEINNQTNVQFIMFAPPVRNENYYDAIDVSALDEANQ